MKNKDLSKLSRREREIMNVIYQKGSATVSEVLEALPSPPSYSAVRTTLNILEEKGFLSHKQKGASYLYLPTLSKRQASRSAAKNLLQTFFQGNVEEAVATLFDVSQKKISSEEFARLEKLIEQAKKEGN